MMVSTTWDGDPPENSFKFRNRILELESSGNEKALSHIKFALLGSLYTDLN
jgi:sulfite reductase alpha subunit-like flavoprotein